MCYLIMQAEGVRVSATIERPCLGSMFVEKSTKTKMKAAYTSPMNACRSRHLSQVLHVCSKHRLAAAKYGRTGQTGHLLNSGGRRDLLDA